MLSYAYRSLSVIRILSRVPKDIYIRKYEDHHRNHRIIFIAKIVSYTYIMGDILSTDAHNHPPQTSSQQPINLQADGQMNQGIEQWCVKNTLSSTCTILANKTQPTLQIECYTIQVPQHQHSLEESIYSIRTNHNRLVSTCQFSSITPPQSKFSPHLFPNLSHHHIPPPIHIPTRKILTSPLQPTLTPTPTLQTPPTSTTNSSKTIQIYLQRIPIRLSQLPTLSLSDYIHLYQQCLQGYQQLFMLIGSFNINNKMVGVNQQAIVKIWFDQYFATWKIMIEKIFDMVNQKIDNKENVIGFKQYCQEIGVKMTFQTVIKAIKAYANKYNKGNIPNKLQTIDKMGGMIGLLKQLKKNKQKNQLTTNQQYQMPNILKYNDDGHIIQTIKSVQHQQSLSASLVGQSIMKVPQSMVKVSQPMPSLETIIVRNMLPRPISPLLSIPQPTLLHNRQYYHSLRPQLSIPTQIQPRHRPLSNSHSRYSLNLSNIQPSSINHPVTNSPPFLLKNNQPTPNSPTLPQLINPRPSSHHPLFHNPNHHHKFSTTKQSNLSLSRHSKLLKMQQIQQQQDEQNTLYDTYLHQHQHQHHHHSLDKSYYPKDKFVQTEENNLATDHNKQYLIKDISQDDRGKGLQHYQSSPNNL